MGVLTHTWRGSLEHHPYLIIRRVHSSWDSPAGVVLMGGKNSLRTTEKIQQDGTSSYSFDLKYSTL